MRNNKGKFIKGHKSLVDNSKNKVSGKFVRFKTDEEKRLRHNKVVMSWHNLHPEYRKKYREEHLEKYLFWGRNNNCIRKYGITLEQKIDLLKQQNYQCLICKKIIDESGAVDHNHETGEIRGILCINCNTGLGNFQDNFELLQRAVSYLKGGELK